MTRLARAFALLVGLAVLCVGQIPPMAAADDAQSSVIVVIDDLTPLIPESGDTLTIRGRVISNTRTELTGISVLLRRSAGPLTSRKEVTAVATSPMHPAASCRGRPCTRR